MGIKGFQSWIRQQFPTSCAASTFLNYSCPHQHLYIDYNSQLHLLARYSRTEASFLKKIKVSIIRTLTLGAFNKSAFVAIDGPASISKIPLQRARREKEKTQSGNQCAFEPLDASCLSPGSILMQRVEELLCQTIREVVQRKRFQNPQAYVMFSGHGTLGEAEDKIAYTIHKRDSLKRTSSKIGIQSGKSLCSPATQHFIVSGDSDMILHAIAAESPFVDILLSGTGNLQGAVQFSKHRFMRELECRLPNVSPSVSRLDFLFLSLLCGTDYLPAVAYANVKVTWPAYIDFREKLSDEKPSIGFVDLKNKKINIIFLKQFIDFMMAKSAFYIRSRLINEASSDADKHQFYSKLDAYKDQRVDIKTYLQLLLQTFTSIVEQKFVGHEAFPLSAENGQILKYFSGEEAKVTLLGPSIFDFMTLSEESSSLLKQYPAYQTKRASQLLIKHPAISAVLMLGKHKEYKTLLPEPLHPFCIKLQNNLYSQDAKEAHDQILKDLFKIPKQSLSKQQLSALFARSSYKFIKSKPNIS